MRQAARCVLASGTCALMHYTSSSLRWWPHTVQRSQRATSVTRYITLITLETFTDLRIPDGLCMKKFWGKVRRANEQ